MPLKARRGAVVVLLGIMMGALMSISAIAIDFSRLWTLRLELQTSADAAVQPLSSQLASPIMVALIIGPFQQTNDRHADPPICCRIYGTNPACGSSYFR